VVLRFVLDVIIQIVVRVLQNLIFDEQNNVPSLRGLVIAVKMLKLDTDCDSVARKGFAATASCYYSSSSAQCASGSNPSYAQFNFGNFRRGYRMVII
jgi:hypothetical protein